MAAWVLTWLPPLNLIPTIGPLVINDQSAEEAFTFYDHPKVLIFKKNAGYTPASVQAVLGKVDYSTSHPSHARAGRLPIRA